MGHAKLAVLISRNWRGGGRCRFGGSLVPLAPLPLTRCEGRIGCAGRVAIIKSRLCRRKAAKVGVPVGHGYNYFLACDTAERIIFAVVAGSGSGKLCRHSRGTDNDQENAGYARESAGGSEQVLRLRARDGEFRAPARVTFFFCKKKVTKENHLDLRSKDPLARYGLCKIGGADLAELVRRVSLSVRGTACTSCAAAADSSEGRGWCAGRFWRLSNRAHCGAKHRNG